MFFCAVWPATLQAICLCDKSLDKAQPAGCGSAALTLCSSFDFQRDFSCFHPAQHLSTRNSVQTVFESAMGEAVSLRLHTKPLVLDENSAYLVQPYVEVNPHDSGFGFSGRNLSLWI